MIKKFTLLLAFVSSLSFACGLHQDTGFSLVTEPGSLDVFAEIIEVRKNNTFGNANKPEHFQLFSIKSALAKPNDHQINFNLFEAIKGHYSKVTLEQSINITGRETLPEKEELLLITELDVLDALATKTLSWDDAKKNQLVIINGNRNDVETLDRWFDSLFLSI
ncbi:MULTISPECIES: hypothetical protein [Aliivibrio]|uniref:hypothetical protein n=1 Tax=Aliivibrio TaxID=511678 RepID=UPI00039B4193|nr:MULTISPECIES: hypothetical protein [Aliivibrio]MBB1311968.1 hypothetical protein [Aliivibrio sp. SR45-2]